MHFGTRNWGKQTSEIENQQCVQMIVPKTINCYSKIMILQLFAIQSLFTVLTSLDYNPQNSPGFGELLADMALSRPFLDFAF